MNRSTNVFVFGLSVAEQGYSKTMATDPTTSYDVHLGAWTNWNRGPVFGATLTLTHENGGLLIAFLAFFVALVGTRFWRLLCFGLHSLYSSPGPKDGVYHQRQAFLRNTSNPEAALWILTNMSFSWKQNAEQVWIRLFPCIGLAIVCLIGFTLAGGFSSQLASLGVHNDVLLSGLNCGMLFDDLNVTTNGDTTGTIAIRRMGVAEILARQCYTTSQVNNCGPYVKKQLEPAIVDINATCPFDEKICRNGFGNLFIDTGLLDSNDDFGRNTPNNRRIQFRRTVHCAPLATEGYRSQVFDGATNQSYTIYYYGPQRNVNDTITLNYTTKYLNEGYPDVNLLLSGSDSVHDFGVR